MNIKLVYILSQLIINNKYLLEHTTDMKLIETIAEQCEHVHEVTYCDLYCTVSDGYGYDIDICFHSHDQTLLIVCPKETQININFLLEGKFQSILHKTRYLLVIDCKNFAHEFLMSRNVREIMIIMQELDKVTVVFNTDLSTEPIDVFFLIENSLHLQLIINSTADITTIEFDIFSKLYQLEMLTLSVQGLRNQFLTPKILTKTFFENFTELRQLDLAGNGMQMLDANIFATLTQLNCLNLSHNEIRELPENLFANQRQLLILDLSHNLLTYLTPHLFDQTPLLWQLKLGGNHLHDTTNLMENLKPLHYLHRLDLSQNKLQTIWSTEATANTTPRSFTNFRYSTMGINLALFVGLNYIIELEPEKYKGSKINSTVINLSGNHLREFSLDWLVAANITCHFEINLEHNLIKNIFALHDFFSTTDDCGREIKMTGNPVVCDCAFAWIYSGNYRSLFNGFQCVQKSTKFIKDLEHNELCARKPVMCPSKCNCYAQSEFLYINCKGTQHIQQLPRPEQVGLNSSVLDISENNFIALPLNTTFGYGNVSQLNASYNKITNISLTQLPTNLTVLDLRNNRLSSLNDEFLRTYLNDSTQLQFLYLSENSWLCDCAAQQLIYTIRTHRTRIPDVEQLLCVNQQNVTLLTANVRELCSPVNVRYYQHVNVTVISVALIIIIFLCIIALFYKYELEVKIWLYSHNILRFCIHECELDEHKKFDAFISYAHQDADFVNHTLLPLLEQCEPPFRVCTHERNWLAGAYIPEQIIESVDQSRRTLIVLSQHFIESDWARMEFRTAHQCSLNEGRARIIMIKYGEIANSEFLDKELKAYLDWQDIRFWDKLRYALPHKVGGETNSDMLEVNGRMYVMGQVEMNRLRDDSV